jgi:BirA family biotin operon repressor/biotin-[acetyl-CoA-carboxylase] ligase
VSSAGESLPIDALRRALASRGAMVGRRLEYHATIVSTNDRARELADAGEAEGAAVLAEEQTRGRGRSGRSWHSAPGLGVYLSVLLRPLVPAERLPLLTLVAAVAGATGVREAAGVDARIKWPNDLVAAAEEDGSRRKLGGILTEGRAGGEGVREVVVGIGINVNHQPGDFPPDLRGRAGSLMMERGRPIDRAAVVLALLGAMERWYRAWQEAGDEAIVAPYRALAVDLQGRPVRVASSSGSWIGVTAGLAGDGALLVRPGGPSGGGAAVPVRFGEVERVEEA